MADGDGEDDGKIYTLYFDKEGNGPTVLELVPHSFDDLKRDTMKNCFGINFKFSDGIGNFNLNNAPVDGGFFFNHRPYVAALHKALGEWLDAHPDTEPT